MFFTKKIDYHGHAIRPGRLEVANRTADAIPDVKIPTTQTDLRSFIGTCSVLCWFVVDFSCIGTQCTPRLLKSNGKDFEGIEKKANRFAYYTREIYLSHTIGLLTKEGKYTHHIDACDRQIECASLQKQYDNVDEPIGYSI